MDDAGLHLLFITRATGSSNVNTKPRTNLTERWP